MIEFSCPNCQKRYQVRDELAGKAAKCKSCGNILCVPSASASLQAVQPPPLPPPIRSAPANVPLHNTPQPPPIRIAFPASPPPPPPFDPARWPPSGYSMSRPQAQQTSQHTFVQPPPAPPSYYSPQPPSAGQPTAPIAAASPRASVRQKRLQAEALQVQNAFASCRHIRVQSVYGDPPERYVVEYHVRGLARGQQGPIYRDEHIAEIQLTSEYPRQSPKCRMLTPIFHPNFEPATICVGDHWTAGERLVDLIVRIAEMISFQAYNIKSPLDGEAAMWADQNRHYLPTDQRDMHPANFN